MAKQTAALGMVFFALLSCSTAAPLQGRAEGAVPERGTAVSPVSRQGPLVITGVSNKMRRQEEEIASALEDAAWKAALYHGLQGSIRTAAQSGPRGFHDFYMNADADIRPLEPPPHDAYRERLRFDAAHDVTRTGSAVFVRFTYPGADAPEIAYPAGLVKGKPRWTQGGLPDSPPYMLAVGFSGKRRYVKETAVKSCESAIAALLAKKAARMEVYDRDARAAGASVGIVETIEGELTGFMVLEIWIDPLTRAVWTLAAAEKQ
jgi:hypothetical protein